MPRRWLNVPGGSVLDAVDVSGWTQEEFRTCGDGIRGKF